MKARSGQVELSVASTRNLTLTLTAILALILTPNANGYPNPNA